ncbi:hypothetical protein TB1_045221 [Malus domestica]
MDDKCFGGGFGEGMDGGDDDSGDLGGGRNLLVRRSTMRMRGVMKKTLEEVYREWRWWEGRSAEISGMGLGWKWWRSWDLKKGWWGERIRRVP